MDLRHLYTFKAIVDEGSFIQAAEKLQYSQAAITFQIQQLEGELGIELFDRQKKKIQLTEAGRTLLSHALHVLNQMNVLQQAMNDLVAGETGHIKVGVIEPLASLKLPGVLLKFCDAHPKIQLTVEAMGTTVVHEKVALGEVDLGVSTPPAAGSGLSFEPFFIEPLVLLVPEQHPLQSLDQIAVSDLIGYRLLLTNPSCAYRQLIERTFIAHGASSYSAIEIGSLEAIKRSVQGGLGIALMPLMAANPAPAGTVIKTLTQLDLRTPIGLVRKSEPAAAIHGKAVETFIGILKSELSQR